MYVLIVHVYFCLLPIKLNVYIYAHCRLTYNESSDSYSNATNVAIIAPGLGNVTTLEYLDEDRFGFKLFPYFKDFVDYFVTKYSYSRGKDLRGAPYDWRLAPGMYYMYSYAWAHALHAT